MLMLPHQSHLPQLTTCIEHPPQTTETTTHHATINKTPTPQGHRQRKWTTNQCITKLTSLNQQQNYSQPAHIISHLRNIDNHNSTTNPSSIKHWHIWSKFGSTSITHIEHRRNINESTTTKTNQVNVNMKQNTPTLVIENNKSNTTPAEWARPSRRRRGPRNARKLMFPALATCKQTYIYTEPSNDPHELECELTVWCCKLVWNMVRRWIDYWLMRLMMLGWAGARRRPAGVLRV